MKKATLDAFMKELRSDVDQFERDWREGHEREPDNYPMSFPSNNSGAWWEQFMAFLSMNGKVDG